MGECVASFASTFPVAFLEPQLNKYNKNSILFGIEEDRIANHSLEAKGKDMCLFEGGGVVGGVEWRDGGCYSSTGII